MSETIPLFPSLRPVDQKRVDSVYERSTTDLHHSDIWYSHTVLAQCFLPYRDQKDSVHWIKKNGNYTLSVTAGQTLDLEGNPKVFGLPFGAKPRLFLSYIQTQAVKTKSPIIPVKISMTRMLKELGFSTEGGKKGSIASFKDQTNRLAACHFRIIGPARKDEEGKGFYRKHTNADLFSDFDVWFPSNPDQRTLWPSEIVLTNEFYENLREYAIPYDFRGLKSIQSSARAQDIFLWMTQRLCRIPANKPVFLKWEHLYEMFGGGINNPKNFPSNFKTALIAARVAYPDARLEEMKGGFLFYNSPPPVPKTRLTVIKPKG